MEEKKVFYWSDRCPFCGSRAAMEKQESIDEIAPGSEKAFFVECLECGAMGPREREIKYAIEAWNKAEKNIPYYRADK